MSSLVQAFNPREQINFLVTNRIPRQLLTQWMGWYSRIDNPWLTRLSIAIWKLFAPELDFSEAASTDFPSLQSCFTRRLKPGARAIDLRESVVVSPCDAIVGESGRIEEARVYQAKGFPYQINDLIPDWLQQRRYLNGSYVTLRLKSSMYHRFHAPLAGAINEVTYISGDTWNVNPPALKRLEKLYCKNERAVLEMEPADPDKGIALVPVAAILVASMRFHCIDPVLDLAYRGPNRISCQARYHKGEELGYFQHGSTIILFATPNYRLCDHIQSGMRINMGEALLIDTIPENSPTKESV